MTKSLKTLIKLHKQFLDEKRRDLVVLEDARDVQLDLIKVLETEFENEKQFINGHPERAYTFEKYAEKVKQKEKEANAKIILLDEEIEQLSEQISEAFTELKKYDLMKKRKEEEAEKELMHKNQIDLDEIGAVSHQRKKEEVE